MMRSRGIIKGYFCDSCANFGDNTKIVDECGEIFGAVGRLTTKQTSQQYT